MDFTLLSFPAAAIYAAFFFAGVIDAVCGGGGLVTIPVMMSVGLPTHWIAGTNQCSTIAGTIISAAKYARSGHVYWKAALATVPFSMAGAFLGSKLNMIVPEQILSVIMLIMIPLLSVMMLVKKDIGTKQTADALSLKQVAIRGCGIGLLLGGYQGFYGPGGGMLLMLALTIWMRLNMLNAAGTTRVIGTAACVSATITYALSGMVLWQLALAANVFNLIGSWIGTSLAITKGRKVIRPMMFAVIAMLMIKVVSDML